MRELTSRRFIIALCALAALTLLGVRKSEPVALAIASIAIGLAGANAYGSSKEDKK